MTLHEAAEKTAGCPVTHAGQQAVLETFRGQTVWEGHVELFELSEPPPKVVYGWTVGAGNGEGPQHVTVLGSGKVDSALAAVRAWIISQSKK